jgi:hypothetical protein
MVCAKFHALLIRTGPEKSGLRAVGCAYQIEQRTYSPEGYKPVVLTMNIFQDNYINTKAGQLSNQPGNFLHLLHISRFGFGLGPAECL